MSDSTELALLRSTRLVAQQSHELRGNHPERVACSLEEWVLAHNPEPAPKLGTPLPRHIPRGTPKECFTNAALLAFDLDGLTYVEGVGTLILGDEPAGIGVHHAWCEDEQGRIVDPTWDRSEKRAYLGVGIDREMLTRWVLAFGYLGILGGHPGAAALVLELGDVATVLDRWTGYCLDCGKLDSECSCPLCEGCGEKVQRCECCPGCGEPDICECDEGVEV